MNEEWYERLKAQLAAFPKAKTIYVSAADAPLMFGRFISRQLAERLIETTEKNV